MRRRKPYDRTADPDDWGERAAWRAITENDYADWSRDQLIELVHSLAKRLLDVNDDAAKIDCEP